MGIVFCAPQTGSVDIRERWGKFENIIEPGLTILNPFFGEYRAGTVSLRLQSLNVRCETKTLDNVFTHVETVVQFRVQDPVKYFYRLTNATEQVTSYVYSVIRAIVPTLTLDSVFTSKSEIGDEIEKQLNAKFSEFGLTIVAAPVTDIDPAPQIKSAMNAIQTAHRLRIAAHDEAEAAKIKLVKAAEAEGESVRIRAAAHAEATFLSGQGTSRQRHAILEGMHEDVKAWSNIENMDARSITTLMMVTQYMDTLRELGQNENTKTIFIPSGPSAVSDISTQMRAAMLHAQAADSK